MSCLRSLADPAADELVAALASRDELWATNLLLRDVHRNRDPFPQAASPEVTAFFRDHGRLPEWACRDALARAASFADAHLAYVSVSLLCASMPLLFANAKGAAILQSTGRMLEDVDARVNETGRFVLDMLEPGAFGSDGKAFVSALKVRLVHASVRHRLRHAAIHDPIDQDQMLGTLLAFSVVVLRSMQRLGVNVRPAEAQDFWHLWRVVGSLLGIRADRLPSDYDEASAALAAVLDNQRVASEPARRLTLALLDGVSRHVKVPGLAERLVRYLIDERIADLIGVPRSRSSGLGHSWLTAHAPRIVAALSPLCGRFVHGRVVQAKLSGREPGFPMLTDDPTPCGMSAH